LITFDPNISAFRNSDTAVQFYDFLLHSAPEEYDFVAIKDWNSAIDAVYLFQNQIFHLHGWFWRFCSWLYSSLARSIFTS